MSRGIRAFAAAGCGLSAVRFPAVSFACCAAMTAMAAVLGFGAGLATAMPGPLVPPRPAPTTAAPGLLPETGSAAVHNDLMCRLRTVWAAAPCRYT